MCQLLKDKTAIVTGASSGNGRGIALALARQGARVVCADLQPDPVTGGYESRMTTSTVDRIRNLDGEAIYVKVDVSRRADVANLVAECVRHYGQLDVMVNNAGIYIGLAPITEESEENYDRVMAIKPRGFGWDAVKRFRR